MTARLGERMLLHHGVETPQLFVPGTSHERLRSMAVIPQPHPDPILGNLRDIDPNQLVKISATTLAVGVMMDALIIRSLLVPALVSLMGRWNWWMPAGWNRTLPRLSSH